MKTLRIRNAKAPRKGAALALMLMTVVGFAVLAAGLMYVSLGRSRAQRGQLEEIRADYVCQAGLSQAMYQLQRGLGGNVGSPSNPTAWAGSQFWVQASNVTPTIIRLTAVGIEDHARASQELTVREVPNTIWQYGAFGREFLHLDSNARVDSYHSGIGTYAAQATNGTGSDQHALSNGDIGSNGGISLDGNSTVWGDAIPGPSHGTTFHGLNATVTGSITPASAQVQFPTINVPAYTSLGNFTVTSNTTLASGNYAYGNLRVNSSKNLTITGPANIVCTNMNLRSNGQIIVDATNGPVNFYVIDDFVLDSNAQIRSTTYTPIDVRMYLLSDNVINPEINVDLDEVDLNSNTAVYGTILAPNAEVILDSNFQMFGALMARNLTVNSNARFHFDEALVDATANENPTFETLCWRELPHQP